jgi:hypothetical protein
MKIIHLVAAIGIGLLSIWFLEFSKPEGAILSEVGEGSVT